MSPGPKKVEGSSRQVPLSHRKLTPAHFQYTESAVGTIPAHRKCRLPYFGALEVPPSPSGALEVPLEHVRCIGRCAGPLPALHCAAGPLPAQWKCHWITSGPPEIPLDHFRPNGSTTGAFPVNRRCLWTTSGPPKLPMDHILTTRNASGTLLAERKCHWSTSGQPEVSSEHFWPTGNATVSIPAQQMLTVWTATAWDMLLREL